MNIARSQLRNLIKDALSEHSSYDVQQPADNPKLLINLLHNAITLLKLVPTDSLVDEVANDIEMFIEETERILNPEY